MATIRTGLAALLLAAGAAHAQPLTTVRLAQGLTRPVFVTAPPGDHSRIFILEQRGSGGVSTQAQIKILKLGTGQINAAPFLTISPVPPGFEQGLLGMAFDPQYAKNGRFYVFYTDFSWNIVIARYTVSQDPDIAEPGSAQVILSQAKQFNNHNGGWIGFGPDGYLYAAIGDGGSEFDPQGYGQSLTTVFGKILRLDVSGPGPGYAIPPTNPFFGSPTERQEIWAYGLRNPFRCSFDRATGDLFIGDVGQEVFEEINYRAHGTPPFAAVNYGWRCYEGATASNTTVGPGGAACSSITNFTFPIHAYPHGPECSVQGGYVYRGAAMPALRGTYFFADYCSAKVWTFRYTGGTVTELTNRAPELATPGQTIDAIVSFGEDAAGELYICDQNGGEIYKIVPRCWANCDGSTGTPLLTANDFQCFLNAYSSQNPYANCDGSTGSPTLTANDFQCFLNKYANGCT
ncbi:MAG: PQQ-dependent sugar dehydrogenase [Phycisphaeraceae bacterium]|nr:PQQ-dependent sugar dehydrogenase [Phycisphaeraceae bacterium]